MKTCFKCGVKKELRMFYKHLQMLDGHLNKCKSCTKKDVSQNYRKNLEHYKDYEKKRFKDPVRKLAIQKYQEARREKYRGKYKARQKVANALRAGTITRQPCEVCNDENAQAHHKDYRKPLAINWLCRKHHLEEHGKNSYN